MIELADLFVVVRYEQMEIQNIFFGNIKNTARRAMPFQTKPRPVKQVVSETILWLKVVTGFYMFSATEQAIMRAGALCIQIFILNLSGDLYFAFHGSADPGRDRRDDDIHDIYLSAALDWACQDLDWLVAASFIRFL